ncbi:YIP1 family protein [Methanocella sp. MCL-LM]|uniref:YIP1 family protein n=1 Tax=Methanocella sp. MCL-LM TaxID=3412035 RepID=UPI003C785AB8
MNFIERIIGTITSPDKTMADVCKEPRWEEGLVIVGLYAILTAVYMFLYNSHITYVSDVPGLEQITLITTIIMGLVMPLIGWIISTAVLFLLAMAFGGEGKFTTLLSGIGFSELVKIFAVVIAAILITQAPYLTIEMSQSNPMASMTAAAEFTSNIFVLVSQVVFLLGLLWSCLIGIFALKHCQKLSFKSAAIVVLVPTIIYIVIQYGALLLMFL